MIKLIAERITDWTLATAGLMTDIAADIRGAEDRLSAVEDRLDREVVSIKDLAVRLNRMEHREAGTAGGEASVLVGSPRPLRPGVSPEAPTAPTAGQLVVRLRDERGVGVPFIAMMCGVHPTAVYAWVRGTPPHKGNLEKLRKVCTFYWKDIEENGND
jgi:hypothetical protein